MTPALRSRLENWKFAQAQALAGAEPPPVQRLIAALAALVGDSGWAIGGVLNQEQERYATWEEAEAGHAALVARVREALAGEAV